MEIRLTNNVGKVKYLVSYYNGKKHPDGSKFFDIACFSNKKKRDKFVKKLKKEAV